MRWPWQRRPQADPYTLTVTMDCAAAEAAIERLTRKVAALNVECDRLSDRLVDLAEWEALKQGGGA